jgi:hypothetical protein
MVNVTTTHHYTVTVDSSGISQATVDCRYNETRCNVFVLTENPLENVFFPEIWKSFSGTSPRKYLFFGFASCYTGFIFVISEIRYSESFLYIKISNV